MKKDKHKTKGKCYCRKCAPGIWEAIDAGKGPGAIGEKTGGSW